jgi:phage shock protein E
MSRRAVDAPVGISSPAFGQGEPMKFRPFALLWASLLMVGTAFAADTARVPRYNTPQPSSAHPAWTLVSQDALLARLAKQDPTLFVLDVRTPVEFAAGHVAGAVNIPVDQVAARLADVPRDKDVVLYCRAGVKSKEAAGLLERSGYKRLGHLEGDMNAWVANAHPIEKSPPAPVKP